ncbi:MAG: hypothetical protein K2H82_02585 [Oscillospiraceae bacterium]|nr:hypothetical protein [Oscillospiraceae bacterium]
MALKDVKLILTAIICFVFGATAGIFYETTHQKIQSEKERKSKVTAKECRVIFEDFVREHDSDLKLDVSFEDYFDEALKISEMTPDEYYKYVEDIYEKSMLPVPEYVYTKSEEETNLKYGQKCEQKEELLKNY